MVRLRASSEARNLRLNRRRVKAIRAVSNMPTRCENSDEDTAAECAARLLAPRPSVDGNLLGALPSTHWAGEYPDSPTSSFMLDMAADTA